MVLQTENFNLSFSLRVLTSEMMLIWPRSALLLPPPHTHPPQPWKHPLQAPSLLSRRRSCERRRVLVPGVSAAPLLLPLRHGLGLKHQPCKGESTGAEGRTWTRRSHSLSGHTGLALGTGTAYPLCPHHPPYRLRAPCWSRASAEGGGHLHLFPAQETHLGSHADGSLHPRKIGKHCTSAIPSPTDSSQLFCLDLVTWPRSVYHTEVWRLSEQ